MLKAHDHPLRLLVALVALGILGDSLLRGMPWGLNVSLWMAAILAVHHLNGRLLNAESSRGIKAALAAAFIFALLVAWRDAAGLKALNLFVVLVSLVLAVMLAAKGSVQKVWLSEYFEAGLSTLASALRVPSKSAPRFRESLLAKQNETEVPYLAVLRGLLFALPLLLIFGYFFFSADANFEALVINTVTFDIPTAIGHLILATLCMWFAAAQLILTREGVHTPPSLKGALLPKSLGAIEINVALTLINLLFATFVIIQLPYFFEAEERMASDSALTYAAYARRGFFELVAVATIALVLLISCARVIGGASSAAKRIYATLGCTLIALVFVIIASSLHRMSIYIDEYGLTRLRIYTASFSIWLGIVYLWLAVTLVRQRSRNFAFGFLISGYVAAFLLQLVNPDSIIIRNNIDLYHETGHLDTEYALSLSADAIPEMIATLETMPPYLQREMEPTIREKSLHTESEQDIRTWSWSRHQAKKAIRESGVFASK